MMKDFIASNNYYKNVSEEIIKIIDYYNWENLWLGENIKTKQKYFYNLEGKITNQRGEIAAFQHKKFLKHKLSKEKYPEFYL